MPKDVADCFIPGPGRPAAASGWLRLDRPSARQRPDGDPVGAMTLTKARTASTKALCPSVRSANSE